MNFKRANIRLTADFSKESRKRRRKWDLQSAKRIVKSTLNNAVKNRHFFSEEMWTIFHEQATFFFKL